MRDQRSLSGYGASFHPLHATPRSASRSSRGVRQDHVQPRVSFRGANLPRNTETIDPIYKGVNRTPPISNMTMPRTLISADIHVDNLATAEALQDNITSICCGMNSTPQEAHYGDLIPKDKQPVLAIADYFKGTLSTGEVNSIAGMLAEMVPSTLFSNWLFITCDAAVRAIATDSLPRAESATIQPDLNGPGSEGGGQQEPLRRSSRLLAPNNSAQTPSRSAAEESGEETEPETPPAPPSAPSITNIEPPSPSTIATTEVVDDIKIVDEPPLPETTEAEASEEEAELVVEDEDLLQAELDEGDFNITTGAKNETTTRD